MSTNTAIKTWQERIVGDVRTYAVDAAKNAEIAELRAALESVQPAAQQDDSDLPQIPPHPEKYMTWREDEIEAIKTYALAAIAQRAGSGEAKPVAIRWHDGRGRHHYADISATVTRENLDASENLFSEQTIKNLARANLELTRRYEEQKLQEKRLEIALERAKAQPDSERDAALREALEFALDSAVVGRGSYGLNYDGNKLATDVRSAMAAQQGEKGGA